MPRPTRFLLAAALLYLYTCLPPAASSPAFLKPEGSYTPRQEAVIKCLDDLVNQFLKQLASSRGKTPIPPDEEDASHDAAEKPHTEEGPPRIACGSSEWPTQADGSSEGGSHEGHETQETQPANEPSIPKRIVFPAD